MMNGCITGTLEMPQLSRVCMDHVEPEFARTPEVLVTGGTILEASSRTYSNLLVIKATGRWRIDWGERRKILVRKEHAQ
jgi:hypothetical protein